MPPKSEKVPSVSISPEERRRQALAALGLPENGHPTKEQNGSGFEELLPEEDDLTPDYRTDKDKHKKGSQKIDIPAEAIFVPVPENGVDHPAFSPAPKPAPAPARVRAMQAIDYDILPDGRIVRQDIGPDGELTQRPLTSPITHKEKPVSPPIQITNFTPPSPHSELPILPKSPITKPSVLEHGPDNSGILEEETRTYGLGNRSSSGSFDLHEESSAVPRPQKEFGVVKGTEQLEPKPPTTVGMGPGFDTFDVAFREPVFTKPPTPEVVAKQEVIVPPAPEIAPVVVEKKPERIQVVPPQLPEKDFYSEMTDRRVDFGEARSLPELVQMIQAEGGVLNGTKTQEFLEADTVVALIYDRLLNRMDPTRDWTKITLRHRLRETAYRLFEQYSQTTEYDDWKGFDLQGVGSIDALKQALGARIMVHNRLGQTLDGATLATYIGTDNEYLLPDPILYKLRSLRYEDDLPVIFGGKKPMPTEKNIQKSGWKNTVSTVASAVQSFFKKWW